MRKLLFLLLLLTAKINAQDTMWVRMMPFDTSLYARDDEITFQGDTLLITWKLNDVTVVEYIVPDTTYGVAILIDWAELNLEDPDGYLPNTRLDIVRRINGHFDDHFEVWRIPTTWSIDPRTYEMTTEHGEPEWQPVEWSEILTVKWRN